MSRSEEACVDHKQHTGFFSLLANREEDTCEALRVYRHCALIELCFRDYRDKGDGKRPRVWADDTLEGRMFVQFVALSYWEFFGNMVAEMKPELGVPNGDEEHDRQKNLAMEKTPRMAGRPVAASYSRVV